LPLLKAKQK